MKQLQNKLDRLEGILREYPSVAVALSGGSDSALLTYLAAKILGSDNVLAVTASGSMVPDDEINEAARLCRMLGVRHEVFPADEFSVEEFRFNKKDRCYHCKKNILSRLWLFAETSGIPAVADGTNADDLKEDRPGLIAAQELSVIKPLADSGITKKEVLFLLDHYGLQDYNKPPMSCFATRFPTDEELTKEKLSTCEQVEKAVRKLGVQGYMRARIVGDTVKLEVKKQEQQKIIQSDIKETAKNLGFNHIFLEVMEEHS